ATPPGPIAKPEFLAAMNMVADASLKAYRALITTPAFEDFFGTATPIAEIRDLKIGSRPASRTKSDRIEDLRAIPWVFSWSQARIMLPGWYGVGQALAGFGDMGLLREMLEAWPFLASTLANMEMVLAKSDLKLAGHSRPRVEDKAAGEAIFGRIRSGWEQAHDSLLAITRQTRLLERNPALDQSIRLRVPYIEPLNLLQVELLRRHRAGET